METQFFNETIRSAAKEAVRFGNKGNQDFWIAYIADFHRFGRYETVYLTRAVDYLLEYGKF